jgi:general secretion pathway protein H
MRRVAGFTLLEMIVVIAVVAIATAGVSLSLRDSSQTGLEREASRLAALLEAARAQSRASGTVVTWRPAIQGPPGFTFGGLPRGSLPTGWLTTDISARPIGPDGRVVDALVLGPEPIIAPQQVLLTVAGTPPRSLRLSTDGLRPFAVVAP